jgi:hypothetical protein
MNTKIWLFAVLFLLSFHFVQGQVIVEKTNPMKVYMHYMPWFETPETIGRWGWHWTMNTCNPELVDEKGHRQIASHFYPLIGPYASRDKDLIEYHLLLMKLSGVDGVLIDWYGVQGSNGDIDDLLTSSNALIDKTDDFGLSFGVVMEDRFSESEADVEANLTYLKDNYFTKPQYIKAGTNNSPLLAIFGPVTFQSASQWTTMLPSAGADVEFLTLWYESGDAGTNADGEFSWVYQDNTVHTSHLTNFYTNQAPKFRTAVGSIYPGFYDYYKEGGAGDGYFVIDHNDGATLDATIQITKNNSAKVDMVQLVTFNDFGEGTMLEPTVETGFSYLEKIQKYTGVKYTYKELNLVYNLYLLRKKYVADEAVQKSLDSASVYLRNLEIDNALKVLEQYELVSVTEHPGTSSAFSAFPNPYSGNKISFNLNTALTGDGKLVIYDMTGKMVAERAIESGNQVVTIENLELKQGIYLPVLFFGSDKINGNPIVVNK